MHTVRMGGEIMYTTHINVERAEEYMAHVVHNCDDMLDAQAYIEAAFNDLRQSWNDVNFIMTGQQLREVGVGMYRMFEAISLPLDKLYLRCKELCENYLDRRPPSKYTIKDYYTKINSEGNMKDTDAIANSEDVLKFHDELGRYISQEMESIGRIISAHRAIQDTWNDNQYDKFTDEIDQFKASFDEQMEILTLLKRKLYFRYESLKRYEEL